MRIAPPRATAYSCHPSWPTTSSPSANRESLLSTTSPTDCAVITSPTCTGFAYDLASLMRPRWYGSTEVQRMRTSTSPGPASGTGASTSSKSASVGNPVGRFASVTTRFVATRTATFHLARTP